MKYFGDFVWGKLQDFSSLFQDVMKGNFKMLAFPAEWKFWALTRLNWNGLPAPFISTKSTHYCWWNDWANCIGCSHWTPILNHVPWQLYLFHLALRAIVTTFRSPSAIMGMALSHRTAPVSRTATGCCATHSAVADCRLTSSLSLFLQLRPPLQLCVEIHCTLVIRKSGSCEWDSSDLSSP